MELYAIRYGTAPFPLKNIFRDMADSEKSIQTDWLLYLAIVNGRVLQFDTGFRSASDAKDWNLKFTDWEQEREALLAGRGVDTVVITHSHFDHADNLDLYPDSRIIISREAMELKMTRGPKPVIERLRGKNVQIVEEEVMIENTFRFKVIGGHERGSCAIYFSSGGRDYVLTGDECYTCANALENRPIGSVFCDVAKNTRFTADIYNQGLVPLPCHDAAVFKMYPWISDNIVRIL